MGLDLWERVMTQPTYEHLVVFPPVLTFPQEAATQYMHLPEHETELGQRCPLFLTDILALFLLGSQLFHYVRDLYCPLVLAVRLHHTTLLLFMKALCSQSHYSLTVASRTLSASSSNFSHRAEAILSFFSWLPGWRHSLPYLVALGSVWPVQTWLLLCLPTC